MMKSVLVTFAACVLMVTAGCSPSPEKLLSEANKYHENKKYDEASILYQKILVKDKTNAEAYYRLGLNLMDQGGGSDPAKLRGAAEAFKRAFDLNPSNTDAGAKVAQIYLMFYGAVKSSNPQVRDASQTSARLRDWRDQIITIDNKILQQKPDSFDGLLIEGKKVAEVDGDLAKAEEIFSKANGIKPYDKSLIEPYAEVLLIDASRQSPENSAVKEKKIDQSVSLLSEALTRDKKWEGGYVILAKIYAATNQRDKLQAILQQHLDADPASASAITSYADYKFSVLKDFAGAEQLMQRLGRDPKNFPNGAFFLGQFYLRANKPELATAAFEQGKRDNPKDSVLYDEKLIELQAASNHIPQALTMARDLIEKNPKNTSVNDLYADLLLKSDTKDTSAKTADEIKKLVDTNPLDSALRFKLAKAYNYANDRDKSLAAVQQAISDEQKKERRNLLELVEYENFEAHLYLEQNNNAKALDLTTLSLNALPEDKEKKEDLRVTILRLGADIMRQRALVGSGQFDKAEPELESLLQKIPDLEAVLQKFPALQYLLVELQEYQIAGELHWLLGNVYLNEQKFDKASVQFDAVSKAAPQDARGMIGLETVKLYSGHSTEAIQGMQQLVSKNPSNVFFRLQLAEFERKAAELPANAANSKQLLAQSEDNYKQILATNASASGVWLDLGAVQRALGETDAALASFEQAGTTDPKNASAFLNRALVLESLHRNKEAIDDYNKVLSLTPDNYMALNNLAMIMADSGSNLDQAQTYAERARKDVPPTSPIVPAISDTLGYVYLQKNLSSQAAVIFRQNVDQNPKNAAFRFHLAQALLKQGDKAGAKEQASKALQGEGATPDLQNKIRAFVGQIG